MTDKEKAEEYLKNNHCNDCMFWDCCYGVENKECVEKTKYIKNHLDGLAEGKPKWHDLRKNPDDLPKHSGLYCVQSGEVREYVKEEKSWFTVHFEPCMNRTEETYLWCELPKFEE